MNQIFKDITTYFMLILVGILGWILYLFKKYPILSFKYMFIMIIIFLALAIILGLSQYKAKNKKIKIIGRIVIVLLCVLIIPVNYIFDKTMNALVQTENYIETDTISVIVKKNSPYQYTQDLKGKVYSVLATDDGLVDKTIKKLQRENKENIKPKIYSGIATLVNALYYNDVDCIIINESYRSIIEESYPAFSDDTKVIYSKQYISEVKSPENKDITKDTFSIYISGIDTYGAITTKSRSDVNIIMTVNPTSKKVLLTSIPRDYYIPFNILDGQKDKLTHSGLYGISETIADVSSYFDIDIDYYVRVNFESLIKIVDTLGGIEVQNPREFGNFKVGTISLNGEEALSFSRERYAFEDGDKERGRNQMRVITGIINKILSPAILKNYSSLLERLYSSFQTNISDEQMISLIRMQLDEMSTWDIQQASVDGSGESLYSPIYGDNLYMMIPDEESITKARNRIKEMYLNNLQSD